MSLHVLLMYTSLKENEAEPPYSSISVAHNGMYLQRSVLSNSATNVMNSNKTGNKSQRPILRYAQLKLA